MTLFRREEWDSRVVNPPHLKILRIDGEGIIDDVIMNET